MRLKTLILLGVFLASLVSVSGQSETVTDFNIGGCIFDFEDGKVGVGVGECSTRESLGLFYCDDNKYGWYTTEVGLGCSMGETDYTKGDDSCCPNLMSCNEIGDGEFQCETRTVSCGTYTTSEDCVEIGDCTWLSLLESGNCVSDITNYDCGYYNTEILCDTDEFNLGQIGIGTELSGGYIECANEVYSIPVENYMCKWYEDSTEDEKCRITYSAVQAGYSDSIDQKIFSCSNVYELDDCVDGKQKVTWFSDSTSIQGFGGGDIPEECLEAFECNGGEAERLCGEPTIKLFGFSSFALFVSLFVIGMYYFVKENEKV